MNTQAKRFLIVEKSKDIIKNLIKENLRKAIGGIFMTKKLNEDFVYLEEMYNDDYYPKFLVDKVKDCIVEVVDFLEKEEYEDLEEVQEKLDEMTEKINDLQDEFDENDSEIETVARDSIGVTVEKILEYFGIDIDIEEAIRERDW